MTEAPVLAATPRQQEVEGPRTAGPRGAAVLPLLLVPSVVVLAVLGIAWFSGMLHAGFWADDFTNLSLYNRTFGDLADTDRNDGKYTINAFWAMATVAFGTGSALPFLLTVSLVTVAGVWLWLRAGVPSAWGHVQAWWIAAVWAATATPFGIMLWSSNIVHAVSLVCLGLAFTAHRQAQATDRPAVSLGWSVTGAVSWLVLIVSNPLYLGALLLGVVFVLRERRGWLVRTAWSDRTRAVVTGLLLAAHAGVPSLYFLLVAYPRTTERSDYSTFGLGEIPANIAYYADRLAPTAWALAAYGVLVLAAAVLALLRLRHDVLPAALFVSGAAVAGPVLMQGTQRADHYLAVPALLLLSCLAAAAQPRATRARWLDTRWARIASVTAAFLALVAVFDGSSGVRAWWVSTPLGSQLVSARQEIADGTATGEAVCVELLLDDASRATVIAGLGGEAGLLLPPVQASNVQLVGRGECAPGTRTVELLDDAGVYRAVVPEAVEQ